MVGRANATCVNNLTRLFTQADLSLPKDIVQHSMDSLDLKKMLTFEQIFCKNVHERCRFI